MSVKSKDITFYSEIYERISDEPEYRKYIKDILLILTNLENKELGVFKETILLVFKYPEQISHCIKYADNNHN